MQDPIEFTVPHDIVKLNDALTNLFLKLFNLRLNFAITNWSSLCPILTNPITNNRVFLLPTYVLDRTNNLLEATDLDVFNDEHETIVGVHEECQNRMVRLNIFDYMHVEEYFKLLATHEPTPNLHEAIAHLYTCLANKLDEGYQNCLVEFKQDTRTFKVTNLDFFTRKNSSPFFLNKKYEHPSYEQALIKFSLRNIGENMLDQYEIELLCKCLVTERPLITTKIAGCETMLDWGIDAALNTKASVSSDDAGVHDILIV